MKTAFVVMIFLILSAQAYNQDVSDNLHKLQSYEDSLQVLADSIINGGDEYTRMNACMAFIPMLVKALQIDGAFDYPFDSLISISMITSPDKKFRLITWQLFKSNGTYRFYGTVVMNDKKKFRMYPLFDNSPFMEYPDDTIVNADAWYGCIYYNVIKIKKYYMLFGWDGNNLLSNKKIIEILQFDKKGAPVFGAPIFHYSADSINTRLVLEYKKDAGVTLNYDKEMKKIVFDHLVPEHGDHKAKYSYVPDGTYEGFVFRKGKLNYIPKIFHYSINQPDNPPMPAPRLE